MLAFDASAEAPGEPIGTGVAGEPLETTGLDLMLDTSENPAERLGTSEGKRPEANVLGRLTSSMLADTAGEGTAPAGATTPRSREPTRVNRSAVFFFSEFNSRSNRLTSNPKL